MKFRVISTLMALGLMISPALAARIDVKINKVSQKMEVFVDGQREYVWPVSTGASGYETPSGKFKAFRLEEDHFSKEWDEAPMPHSVFFTTRGHAIHGSFSKRIGQRASHGCVRLHPENAETLFNLVEENGLGNTHVEVRGGFFDFAAAGGDTTSTRRSNLWGSRPSPIIAIRNSVKDGERKIRRSPLGGLFGTSTKPKPIAVKKTAKKPKKKVIVVGAN
jgi:hypothetical protein